MDATPDRTTFLIGTSGWVYDHWRGCFYPAGMPKSRWFDYYCGYFRCVEINATFYRPFREQTYVDWGSRAPQDFRYVLKVPRRITHRKYLADVEEDVEDFCRCGALLADKLGIFLLQLAPNTPYDLERLYKVLLAFPEPDKVTVEFRNPRWLNDETESLLRQVGAVFCNVDSPRQKLTATLTSHRAYLRLHGRSRWYLHNYSRDELQEIAAVAQDLAQRGADLVYIFFNNDFEGYAPANAMTLMELLNGL